MTRVPRLILAPILLASLVSTSLQADPASPALPRYVPGNATTIATPDSDIRPTWTPDGRLRLWGTIDAEGRHEIVEQFRHDRGWGEVQRSSLNAGDALDATPRTSTRS